MYARSWCVSLLRLFFLLLFLFFPKKICAWPYHVEQERRRSNETHNSVRASCRILSMKNFSNNQVVKWRIILIMLRVWILCEITYNQSENLSLNRNLVKLCVQGYLVANQKQKKSLQLYICNFMYMCVHSVVGDLRC